MSYARFGWDGSDVYVFENSNGYLECCMCLLQERETVDDPEAFFGFVLKPVGERVQYLFEETVGMLQHLKAHRQAGHTVPDDTFRTLRDEQQRLDTDMAKAREGKR